MDIREQIDAMHEAITVDQIILRALLREVVKRLAAQSPNPDQATREICGSLQNFVSDYSVPGTDMEEPKEKARLNLDQLSNSLRHSG